MLIVSNKLGLLIGLTKDPRLNGSWYKSVLVRQVARQVTELFFSSAETAQFLPAATRQAMLVVQEETRMVR